MAILMKTSISMALALATLTLPAAANAATTVNVSTGQGAKGTVDPKWKLGGVAPVYIANVIHPNWAFGTANTNADGARWVTPQPDGNANIAGPANFDYTTVFTLSNLLDLATAKLNGKYWADNRVLAIFLNGTPLPGFVPVSGSQFALGANGTLTNAFMGSFLAGANTLTFRVRNDAGTSGNPSGFRLAGLVTAVPEPGAWLLMLMGFGFVGFQMRRRQKIQVRFQFA